MNNDTDTYKHLPHLKLSRDGVVHETTEITNKTWRVQNERYRNNNNYFSKHTMLTYNIESKQENIHTDTNFGSGIRVDETKPGSKQKPLSKCTYPRE